MDSKMNEAEVKKFDKRNGKECKKTSGQSDHCKKCHMNFDAFDQFVDHKCQSSPFPCSLCPEKFDFDFQRNIHMKTMHSKDALDATQSEPGKSKASLAEGIDCKVCKVSSKKRNDSGRSEMEVDLEEGDIDHEVNGTGASKDEGTRKRSSKRNTVVNPSDKTEKFSNLKKRARCKLDSAKSGVSSNRSGEDTDKHSSKDEGTHKRSSKRKTVVNPSDKIEKCSNLRKRARCESNSEKSGVSSNHSGEDTDKHSSKEENEKSGVASLATLIKALPDDEYAVLLQSEPANNSNFKCAKCCKVFRSFKFAASHYTSCKSKLQKNASVPDNVKWVCTHCNSLFIGLAEFLRHKRICSETSMQIGSVKKKLLATVNESKKSKSYQPFNKECSKCHQICYLSCENPSCQDLRKYNASCVVYLRKLPFTDLDIQSGAYLYECVNCKIVFTDNRVYLKHMEGAHGISEVTQGKPLLFPPAYKALKRIKTEMPPPEPPQAPSAEPLPVDTKALFSLLAELKRTIPSCDQDVPDNGDIASSGFASSSQGAEGQEDSPLDMSPEQNIYVFFNLLLCKCNPKKSGDAPCLECIPDIPPEIIHSLFTGLIGSTRVEAPNFGAFESTLETPPVSHTGFTPPPTPESKSARADNPDPDVSMAFEPACSTIFKENRTSPEDDDEGMDELQIDPSPPEKDSAAENCQSRSTIFEENRTSPEDDDEGMDELQIDPSPPEKESAAEKTVKIVHIDNYLGLDAYELVSPTDPNNVENYVCLHCFEALDIKSLLKHMLNQHNFNRDVINVRLLVNHQKPSETHA